MTSSGPPKTFCPGPHRISRRPWGREEGKREEDREGMREGANEGAREGMRERGKEGAGERGKNEQ